RFAPAAGRGGRSPRSSRTRSEPRPRCGLLWEGLDAGAVVLLAPAADLVTPALRFTETFGFSREVRERMHRRLEEREGRSWSVFDAIELAPALTPPVLVIHDRGDAEVPWQHGAAIARAWRESEMLMTEGLGHERILRD